MPKKKKKKKQQKIEQMTEEEVYGFYFIAGYTPSGMPFGITMEEAEEQGLVDKNKQSNSKVSFNPFDDTDEIDENNLPF